MKTLINWHNSGRCPLILTKKKMAQEIVFSRKKSKVILPSIIFNGKDVSRSESHKHRGLVFDPKLNFDMHLKGTFSIANNGIALLRK